MSDHAHSGVFRISEGNPRAPRWWHNDGPSASAQEQVHVSGTCLNLPALTLVCGGMCVYLDARAYSYILYLIPLSQGLSLTLELD